MAEPKMARGGAYQPGWLSRHKWFLPAAALALMSCCVLGGVAGLLDLFGSLRGWPVYGQALEAIRADPRVIDALGQPIEPGWIFSGLVEESTGAMKFNIAGPKESATVAVSGVWDSQTGWRPLVVEVYPHAESAEKIEVIGANGEPRP